MDYFITFLEGFISFISPCMLPMLPIYISYFAGTASADDGAENHTDGKGHHSRTFAMSLFFVFGFTAVFCLLGLFAGVIGGFLSAYQRVLDILCGAIVVALGLSFLDIIKLPFFKGINGGKKVSTLLQAFIFGAVFSLSLTPCVGAFLGSALMLASVSGTAVKGFTLLLAYSLGLGIPFVLSAIAIDKLRGAFGFIKSNYKVINTVCGIFLIVVGILMMCGLLNVLLGILS